MLRCAVWIMVSCIGCYSIFIAWRIMLIHDITLPPFLFWNVKYVKVSAEHILLNFNSAINPIIYIMNNRSIKRKMGRGKSGDPLTVPMTGQGLVRDMDVIAAESARKPRDYIQRDFTLRGASVTVACVVALKTVEF